MTQKPAERTKPWPLKKRFAITGGISAFIFVSAILLGSMVYWTGRIIGIFSPLSLFSEVVARALNDPALLRAYEQALKQRECVNEHFGYRYSYTEKLTVTPAVGDSQCSELTFTTNDNGTGYIKIMHGVLSATEEVDYVVQQYQHVETASVSHPRYEGTAIQGQDRGIPLYEVILSEPNGGNWRIMIFPFEQTMEAAVETFVNSFRILEGS